MRRGAENAWRAGLFAVLLLGALVGSGALPAHAQQTTAPQLQAVLTVNQERLFSQSLYGERVVREREVAAAALTAENRKIEAALAAEEKDLTAKRKTMKPSEFRVLADAFDSKVQGIRKAQDGKARALARQQEEEQKIFFGKVIPILTEILKDRQASAILDRRAILVATDAVDITDDALRRIDATLGDGKVEK